MPDTHFKKLYQTALNLLARREHAPEELAQKLAQRAAEAAALIPQVIAHLSEKGLLSEARFASAYVRSRGLRGFGPLRIKEELHQRGVSDAVIALALQECECDLIWEEVAQKAHKKRFETFPKTSLERAKQIRFLQYRGFPFDVIQKIFHPKEESIE